MPLPRPEKSHSPPPLRTLEVELEVRGGGGGGDRKSRAKPELEGSKSKPIVGIGIAYIQTGASFLHMTMPIFTIWPDGQIVCADSDRRSSVNQGRGSLFRHTGCTTQ
jgi:hypothetical protein